MTGRLLGLKVVQPKEFPILSLFVSPDETGGLELEVGIDAIIGSSSCDLG